MTAKRGKKPAKPSAKKSQSESPPSAPKKEPDVKLEAPAIAPSAKAALAPSKPAETAKAPEKPVAVEKVSDPSLPPLPAPTPPPPPNPDTLPFEWKDKRPEVRPCHRCLKPTKLTTNTADVDPTYVPEKDDEGFFGEWFGNLIVTVVCAPCWRTGFGHNW